MNPPFTVRVSYRATAKTLVLPRRTAPLALLAAAHQCRGGFTPPQMYTVCKAGVVQLRATQEEVEQLRQTVARIRS